MSPRHRLGAVIATAVLALLMAGCSFAGTPAADPSSSAPVESVSPTPTPTPTPTPEAVAPTCDNIATAGLHAESAEIAWITWELPGGPFDNFANGAPQTRISCRWGADPDLATDNVMDIAWASISAEDAAAAQAELVGYGYERIEAPEGVYFAVKGEQGWGDAEGWAQTFLFTDTDVRWAGFKDEVRFVKAPDEQG